MRQFRPILVLGLALVFCCACQPNRPYAADPPRDDQGQQRNHGYALLYSTVNSLAGVDRVLFIKRPREEVREFLRAVAGFATDARNHLQELGDTDATLGMDDHGLPHAEARARDMIASATGRTIMAAGGESFELQILLTQYESLKYIRHLARAVAELDDEESRKQWLGELADRASELYDEVIDLLGDSDN
ncbi:MAG: hypothetical protein JJU36_02650 [Phycisphaeraceae bacterium]|nr:hypothetical protein [Phycisphaeraceae bacterium]